MSHKTAYDWVHYYMNDLSSRVVAKTGIPTDRFHLGKLIMHSFQEEPEFVFQIDGATNQSETNASALDRSVRCAIAIKALGLKAGDVMVLMGPNHIDLCIPHYAGLYLGVLVAAIDATLGVSEMEDNFNVTKPKIIFCQSDKVDTVEKALALAGIQATIVTFDEGSNHSTLVQFLRKIDEQDVKGFQPTNLDATEATALLTSTSGTTGTPKAAVLSHKNLCTGIPYLWSHFSQFPKPTKMVLVMSPLQWLTAGIYYLFGAIFRVTRLQSSAPITPDHFAYLINTYKPTLTATSPVLMNTLLSASDKCDLSCLESVLLGGSAVYPEILTKLRELTKSQKVYGIYGMSEVGGPAFFNDYTPPTGSSGSARGCLEYRLVNPVTGEDITEPNVNGELWLRGPQVFKGYYNNPEMTAEALTKDGWMKTGDIFYRNEYWHFFFVERNKSLLKYRNHQIAPIEVETVIRKHPGVEEVCVTGIPDKECGDLVVACVVPKPDWTPKAQEIKDIVKESLTDSKQLRGGVIFMKEFPLTSSSKINRKKIKELVLTKDRE